MLTHRITCMAIIRKYTFTALALIFVVTSGYTSADAQSNLREIMKRMDTHYKALKSLEANVYRVQANSQIGTSEDSSGTVVFVPAKDRKASKVLLSWTKPRREILSIANGLYQLYVPDIKRAYRGSTSSQNVGKAGGGVLSMMNMSEAELRTNYTAQYIGQVTLEGAEVWHIRLNPKARQSFQSAEMWVNGDGMPVQIRVTAHNRDTDLLRFSGIKRNIDVKGSVFEVKPAKGTEIIKQ
jgi:outer membrane lipoprotein-sorting protein